MIINRDEVVKSNNVKLSKALTRLLVLNLHNVKWKAIPHDSDYSIYAVRQTDTTIARKLWMPPFHMCLTADAET